MRNLLLIIFALLNSLWASGEAININFKNRDYNVEYNLKQKSYKIKQIGSIPMIANISFRGKLLNNCNLLEQMLDRKMANIEKEKDYSNHLELNVAGDVVKLYLEQDQTNFEKVLVETIRTKQSEKGQALASDFEFVHRPDLRILPDTFITNIKLEALNGSLIEKYKHSYLDDTYSIESLEAAFNSALNQSQPDNGIASAINNKTGVYDFYFRNRFFYCDAIYKKVKMSVTVEFTVENPVVVDLELNKELLLQVSDSVQQNKRIHELGRNEENQLKIWIAETRILENAFNKVKTSNSDRSLSKSIDYSQFVIVKNKLFESWPQRDPLNLRQFAQTTDNILLELETKNNQRTDIYVTSSVSTFRNKNENP